MDNSARALSIAAPTSGFRGVFDPEGFFGGTIDQWASLALILLVSLSVWDRVVPRRNPRAAPRRRRHR